MFWSYWENLKYSRPDFNLSWNNIEDCQFCLLLYSLGMQTPKITPLSLTVSISSAVQVLYPADYLIIYSQPCSTSFVPAWKDVLCITLPSTENKTSSSVCLVFTWHVCNEKYRIIKRYGGVLTPKDLREHKANFKLSLSAQVSLFKSRNSNWEQRTAGSVWSRSERSSS